MALLLRWACLRPASLFHLVRASLAREITSRAHWYIARVRLNPLLRNDPEVPNAEARTLDHRRPRY